MLKMRASIVALLPRFADSCVMSKTERQVSLSYSVMFRLARFCGTARTSFTELTIIECGPASQPRKFSWPRCAFSACSDEKRMPITHLLASALGGEILDMLSNTGVVAKIVLMILLVFSLLSWTIILSKYGLFRRASVQSGRFVRVFRRATRLQELTAVAEQFKPSPLVAVFEGAVEELKRGGSNPRTLSVHRATQIAASEELTRLESRLTWLATTGSITPFIGLFGTVWGIIDAFHGLGTAGAATLRAVAPGISEALITTAAGLFAAIPAVIFYNLFLQQIRDFAARMDDFSLELLNIIDRNGDDR